MQKSSLSAGGSDEKDQSWIVDFSSFEGRLETIMPIIKRHPQVVTANLQFRRNLVETLEPVPGLLEQLQDRDPFIMPGDSQLLILDYAGASLKPDKNALKELRETLIANLRNIQKHIPVFHSLAQDIKQLPRDRSLITQFFSLLPFTYDVTTGGVLSNDSFGIESKIRDASVSQIASSYKDTLPEHFVPLVNKTVTGGVYQDSWNALHNNFISKIVARATTYVDDEGKQGVQKTVSIEKLPEAASILRGCFGQDCSILSVPYYGLSRKARVYLVRNNDRPEASPDGYIFSVLVNIGGKEIPYVITVNGALSRDAVKAALALVAKDWGVDQLAVPRDPQKMGVVNTPEMVEGLNFEQFLEVNVDFDDDWKIISDYTNKINKQLTGYNNYYDPEQINKAKLIKPQSIQSGIRYLKISSPYPREVAFGESRLLDRALFAAQVINASNTDLAHKLKQTLNVTDEEIRIASKLANVAANKPLRGEDFTNLSTKLGFSLNDLLLLDPYTRSFCLRRLFLDLMPKDEKPWQKQALDTWKYFQHQLELVNHTEYEEIEVIASHAQLALITILKDKEQSLFDKLLKENSPDELLVKAAQSGQLFLLEKALQKGVSSSSKDFALQIAAESGELEALKYLIASGANIHADSNRTMRSAVERGRPEIVEYLLSLGKGEYDLDYYLIMTSDLEVIECLLDNGANINTGDGVPLRNAVRLGNIELLEYLQHRGANIHACDLLKCAVESRQYEAVSYLLGKGLVVNESHLEIDTSPAVKDLLLEEKRKQEQPLRNRTSLEILTFGACWNLAKKFVNRE